MCTFQVLRSWRGAKTERLLQVNGNGMDAERMGVNGEWNHRYYT